MNHESLIPNEDVPAESLSGRGPGFGALEFGQARGVAFEGQVAAFHGA